MSEWNDRVVIVTGASSGIGAEIAAEFAKHGSAVVLVGRNEKKLKTTAEKCEKLGLIKEMVLCIVADMNNDDAVKGIVKKTVEKFGKINVLVNNAGFGKPSAVPYINMKDFDEIMRVNLRSVVLLSQEAVPYLIKTKGNIVNISSIGARDATPGFTAYSTSKAALDHFTRCAAIDLAPKDVRINSVLPGPIPTNFAQTSGIPEDQYNALIKQYLSQHPMGKIGTVEDIARATIFLASDSASYITGHNLPVDGGKGM